MNDQTNLIELMIQQVETAKVEAEAQKTADVKAKVAELDTRIAAALGDLWAELQPYRKHGSYRVYTKHNQAHVALSVPFEPIEWQLAPFYVLVNSETHSVLLSRNKPFDGAQGVALDKMMEFFYERREEFPAWNEERIEKLTDPLTQKLFYYRREILTPDQADEVLAELIAIDPAHEDQWMRCRKDWYKGYLDSLEAEAEKEQREKAEAEASEVYAQAYRAYVVENQRVLGANREIVARLQETLDQPYETWVLTYALLAEDAGERQVDTDQELVLNPDPDSLGYWQEIRGGNILRVRFFHPVSVEGPRAVRPGDENTSYAGRVSVPEAGMHIWYGPGVDIQARLAEAGFEALPEPPEEPGILEWTKCRQIRTQIYHEEGLADQEYAGYEF